MSPRRRERPGRAARRESGRLLSCELLDVVILGVVGVLQLVTYQAMRKRTWARPTPP